MFLMPKVEKKIFINRVVETRNYFAHRMDMSKYVLQGADLWNHTEIIKAIGHMALINAIGGSVVGIGKTMRDNQFVQYAKHSDN